MIGSWRGVLAVLVLQTLACRPDTARTVSTALPESERTEIVLDPSVAGSLRQRAYRQGPIRPPVMRQLPCRAGASPHGSLSVVETIIDERGRVVWASVVAGVHGPDADRAARRCLSSAVFDPATLDGRPVPVYFSLSLALERSGNT